MPINAVIFDLGGVLLRVDERVLVQRTARLLGAQPEEARAHLTALQADLLAYELGRLNTVEVYRRILSRFSLEDHAYPFSQFSRDFCAVLRPMPRMMALFDAVRAVRPTYILSNTNPLHWDHMARRYPRLTRASGTFTSFECGLYKPDPAIYREALARFGLQADRALFIDDRPENVEAARAVGMTLSFVHRTPAATRARLLELGLLLSDGRT